MFIHTRDNHVARFALEDGRIFFIACGKYRGLAALTHIKRTKSAAYSFADGVYNNQAELPLPNTEDLFELLSDEIRSRQSRLERVPLERQEEFLESVVGSDSNAFYELPGTQEADATPGCSDFDDLTISGSALYELVMERLALYVGPISSMICGDYEQTIKTARRASELEGILADISAQVLADSAEFSERLMEEVRSVRSLS